MNNRTLDFLEAHKSDTPSMWKEEAEWRRDNAEWLRYSQQIAVKVLLRMKELNLTKADLSALLNCSEEYITKILKGTEKLSNELILKLEKALNYKL